MDLDQLRSFITIAREQSFTRAAEKLFLTQSALSQQMKVLEQAVGEHLFERHGRQLVLTAAGRIIQERATTILGLVEQMTQEVAALQGLQQGRIRIGASDTICLYLLPPVVQGFRARYPAIEIHLTNLPSGEILAQLNEGLLDLGIITLPAHDPKLQIEHLLWREDRLICRPGHPLLAQAEVKLTDLMGYSLLLLEKGSTTRALLDQLFAAAQLSPQIIDLGSIEVIKRYVEIDLGIAIVPAFAVESEVGAGRLQTMPLPWLPLRAVGLITRNTGYFSPASRAFLQMLRAAYPVEAG